jgi:type I restriction enzyme M protein
MSSQASSAGRDEAKVRQALVETGDVDIMVAVRSNFFYTRTVPCELWFFDRARPAARRDQVLMIDARNIYRKVTRKIYDFSPEQEQNLLAIVWLYRSEPQKFLDLVGRYCQQTLDATVACFQATDDAGKRTEPLYDFYAAVADVVKAAQTALPPPAPDSPATAVQQEVNAALALFRGDIDSFESMLAVEWPARSTPQTSREANFAVADLADLAERSRDLVRQADLLYKLAGRLAELADAQGDAGNGSSPASRGLVRSRKAADEARALAVARLKQVRTCWRQAHWLMERFPDAVLRDVAGLVKLVERAELAANDWSLTPGRYVGVAPEEVDEEFDFEETLRGIHVELEDLNAEAVELAVTIKRNFEELGI